MKVGIIGAMAEEIALLESKMVEPTIWKEAGAKFISGRIGEHEVVVVESGIGKVLAAVTATLLISHYQVEVLINTGSAGGIGAGLKVGDLVISSKLAYYDVDVTAFGYEYGQMAGMPLFYDADEKLIELSEKAAVVSNLDTFTGLIVSGDSFVNGPLQSDAIKAAFPAALACEMEGAAIAQVAFRYQVPFVVIRAMSDTGDESANVTFDEFIVTAGRKSAEMVLNLLAIL